MLDDCKGDKFTEVLAVFSTMVVKRVIPSVRHPKPAAVSLKTALSNSLDVRQQRSLLPLAIAHKASLTALLKRRDALKDRYASFADSLDANARHLKMREQSKQSSSQPMPQAKAIDSLYKQLSDTWVGNAAWIDVIMHGEDKPSDKMQDQEFDPIWDAASHGRPLDSVAGSPGLLAELESRVQHQQRRLSHWHAFHDEIRGSIVDEPSNVNGSEDPQSATALSFDRHKALKIDGEAKHEAHSSCQTPSQPPASQLLYSNILSSMRERLIGTAPAPKRNTPNAEDSGSSSSEKHHASEQTNRIKPLRIDIKARRQSGAIDNLGSSKSAVSGASTAESPTSADSRWTENSRKSPLGQHMITSASIKSPSGAVARAKGAFEHDLQGVETNISPQLRSPDFENIKKVTPVVRQTPSPVTDGGTSEEVLAQQIIASVPEATPIPTKVAPLSLADRTRMSIAHSMPRREIVSDTESELPDEVLPTLPNHEYDRRTSLLERTRQSMTRLSTSNPTGPRFRHSIIANNAKRRSIFPVNQFETPKRQPSLTLTEESSPMAEGSTTPKELLFSDEAEYASVFKSRPKIALSPVYSPKDMGASISSLDGAMDSDASALGSSPLGRLGVGAAERGI